MQTGGGEIKRETVEEAKEEATEERRELGLEGGALVVRGFQR